MRWVLACFLVACGARSDLEAPGREGGGAVETCNGVDDDGDGSVDEGIEELSCGVGACARTAPGCVGGEPGECVAGTPGSEVCNEVDDDCDGSIDEGLGFGLIAGPFTLATGIAQPTGLVATDAGLVAAWTIAVNGSDPMPNAFTRALGALGEPLADTTQLTEEVVSFGVGPSLAPVSNGRLGAAMCRRFGFEEFPSWMFLDTSGLPLAEHVVGETSEVCVTFDTAPQLLWTGERHLYAWITSSGDFKVRLESSDAEGGDASVAVIVERGDVSVPPRLAFDGERVALVAGLQPEELAQSELGVFWLDRAGRVLSGPIVLPDPGGTRYLQARAAFAADGTLVVVAKHRFGPGWIRARIAADGSVIEGPVLLPEELELRGLERREGGGFWAVAYEDGAATTGLYTLDDAGQPSERWGLPETAYDPYLALRGGRVHVLYGAPGATPFELKSVTYGCSAP
jgi:hypothetical protein